MTGKEIFKARGLAKMTNTRVLKYGKVAENIGYEIVETNNYNNEVTLEKNCILSFVTKNGDKYIYNTDDCVFDTFTNIMTYIAECKKEKRIIKREEK